MSTVTTEEAAEVDIPETTDLETTDSTLPPEFQAALDKMDPETDVSTKTKTEETDDGDDDDSAVESESAADDSEEEDPGGEEGEAGDLTWPQERSYAKELGINTQGMKRAEVQAAILRETRDARKRDAEFGDLRDQARAYGLDDSEISSFENPAELRRTLGLLDRQSLAQQAQTQDAGNGKPATDDQQTEPVKLSEETEARLEAISEKYEDAPELVSEMRSLYESQAATEQRVNQLLDHVENQQTSAQADTDARDETRFHELVGELGFEDVFGEIGEGLDASKLNQEQVANRKMIFNTWFSLAEGDRSKITKPEVERALRASFHEHVDKKQKREQAAKIKARSRKRTGSGGGKVNGESYDGPLENDPDLHRQYKDLIARQ